MNWPFITTESPSLSLVILLALTSILFNINIVIPLFFWLMLHDLSFSVFLLLAYLCLYIKIHFLLAANGWILLSHPLCFLILMLRQFIFSVVMNRAGLKSSILIYIFYLSPMFFVPFCFFLPSYELVGHFISFIGWLVILCFAVSEVALGFAMNTFNFYSLQMTYHLKYAIRNLTTVSLFSFLAFVILLSYILLWYGITIF